MSDIGVMVCGHGSRDEQAVAEFASVARGIRERLPHYPVESGFLEFATPIIRDGLDKLRAAGCRRVLAVPGMLFAAGHAKNDIPAVLNTYQAQQPEMSIDYGRELAIDAKLINAAADRVGGPLVDLHVHDAHFIRLLFGMPTTLTSQGRLRGDVVEHCSTLFGFSDPPLRDQQIRQTQMGPGLPAVDLQHLFKGGLGFR